MMKQEISLTTDAVVFSEEKDDLTILLVKRKNDPYQGFWALPGGFLEKEETLQEGCCRELEEETGLKLKDLQKVDVYDKVDRDPRGRSITVAFMAQVKDQPKVKGNDDAADAQWVSVESIKDLAFDHNKIVQDALELLKMQQ